MRLVIVTLTILLLQNKPESVVKEFYDWYFDQGLEELKPRFSELPNGMTSLDFSHVDTMMTKYRFSEEFIQLSKSYYKNCVEKLATVPYKEFSELDDIEDIENLGCHLQPYRWINDSIEPYDYYQVVDKKRLSKSEIKYRLEFGYEGSEEYKSTAEITLALKDGNWYIENIE